MSAILPGACVFLCSGLRGLVSPLLGRSSGLRRESQYQSAWLPSQEEGTARGGQVLTLGSTCILGALETQNLLGDFLKVISSYL